MVENLTVFILADRQDCKVPISTKIDPPAVSLQHISRYERIRPAEAETTWACLQPLAHPHYYCNGGVGQVLKSS